MKRKFHLLGLLAVLGPDRGRRGVQQVDRDPFDDGLPVAVTASDTTAQFAG
jgi:hypothetical protein